MSKNCKGCTSENLEPYTQEQFEEFIEVCLNCKRAFIEGSKENLTFKDRYDLKTE